MWINQVLPTANYNFTIMLDIANVQCTQIALCLTIAQGGAMLCSISHWKVRQII